MSSLLFLFFCIGRCATSPRATTLPPPTSGASCTPIPPRGKSSATSQRRTIRADYQTGAFSQQIMRWWDRRRGKELCSIDRVSMIRSRWWDRVRGKELLGYEIPQFNKHRKVYRRHHLFYITLPVGLLLSGAKTASSVRSALSILSRHSSPAGCINEFLVIHRSRQCCILGQRTRPNSIRNSLQKSFFVLNRHESKMHREAFMATARAS